MFDLTFENSIMKNSQNYCKKSNSEKNHNLSNFIAKIDRKSF